LEPESVSETVAVHWVEASALNDPGAQVTAVLVERLVAVTFAEPELVRCLASPW
jgi:hypothetical protein